MEINEQEDNSEDYYEEEEGDILSGSCCRLWQPADSFSINVWYFTLAQRLDSACLVYVFRIPAVA